MTIAYKNINSALALLALVLIFLAATGSRSTGTSKHTAQVKTYLIAVSSGPGLHLTTDASSLPGAQKTGKNLVCDRIVKLNVLAVGMSCVESKKYAAFVPRL